MNRKTGEELVKSFEEALFAYQKAKENQDGPRSMIMRRREFEAARIDLIEVCDFSINQEV